MVFLSVVRCAKKVKSRFLLVMVESTVSGHRVQLIRERLGDKMEFVKFDPFVQQPALYREKKKIRSIK